MAASNYDAALARVLKHEGGYTHHPSDPGGPTNWGITLADYARFKGRSVTAAEVRAMPLADAKTIYKERYWNALRCDELPAGLDYAVFDYGVNSGIGRAAKVLRRLLRLPEGGSIDGRALAAVKAADIAQLIARLCDERLAFLRSLKTWPVFGAGWGRRVAEVRRDALLMAKGTASAASAARQDSGGKAQVPAPRKAQIATASASAMAGAAAAAAAEAAGGSVCAVAALAAAALVAGVAGWIGWSLWRKRRQEAPMDAAEEGA